MSTSEKLYADLHLKVREPELFDVLLLNDDFTTMDFVVQILTDVFFKGIDEAEQIMLAVHRDGEGVAGTFTFDIALSKVNKATELAREAGYPLRLKIKQV